VSVTNEQIRDQLVELLAAAEDAKDAQAAALAQRSPIMGVLLPVIGWLRKTFGVPITITLLVFMGIEGLLMVPPLSTWLKAETEATQSIKALSDAKLKALEDAETP